ncbi:TnsD family Tn7-like transposition protein [Anaerobacillus sp. 1_MG-2023]|uniref:TnsD family Tn7-like transposition protein n=1 Tax=Anaerobacillus sp. 1_MG-2023 TaxID=3062655 RepID=UPI0026E3F1BC|nr:TnsD family Tn7-like transposition protein [Anaerobacillus sp. 1_MG-2023]MDO6657186.1 TnsD family Tn7-like transposition protein [Anaerobacillus sp. 1_MG-2023]
MINIFPQPFSDEYLYSVIARYHKMSGNHSYEATYLELFNSKAKVLLSDLPNDPQQLQRNTALFSVKKNSKRWILDHTAYNYYTYFMMSDRSQHVLEHMVKGTNKSISLIVGKSASRVKENIHMKICPECYKSEFNICGTPYWHTHHQLPGVFVCAIHHTKLIESNLKKKHHHALQLPAYEVEYNKTNNISEVQREMQILISITTLSILTRDSFTEFEISFHRIYKNILKELGYITKNERVRKKKLMEDFKICIKPEFLEFIGLDEGVTYSTVQYLWLNYTTVIHPLFHIMFLLFLFKQLKWSYHNKTLLHVLKYGEKLENMNKRKQEALNNQLVCLNHKCSHYKTNKQGFPSINYYEMKGSYLCTNCGFRYYKLNFSNLNKFKWDMILSVGWLLEEEIKSLKEKELTCYKIAKELSIPENSVKKVVEGRYIERSVKRRFNRDIDRPAWLELLDSYPFLSKSELAKKNYALYKRLFYNDREWLHNQQYTTKKRSTNSYIDWQKRDEEFLVIMKNSFEELMQSSPPIRITKNSVIKHSNLRWDSNSEYKMPNTKKYLSEINEEWKFFYIRRAEYIINEQLKLPFEDRRSRKKMSHLVGYFNTDDCLIKEQLKNMLDEYFLSFDHYDSGSEVHKAIEK